MKKDTASFISIFFIFLAVLIGFQLLYKPEQADVTADITQVSETSTAEPTTEFQPWPVPLDINLQWYLNAQCEVKGIPTELALALIWRESRYQADVISATNDYGLMQVNACNKAEVERVLNVTNLLDPYQNCKAGLYILDRCIEQTDTLDKALMIYNLGESGAKAQWQKGVYSTDFSRSVIQKMNELER